jgi:hypothetical protein
MEITPLKKSAHLLNRPWPFYLNLHLKFEPQSISNFLVLKKVPPFQWPSSSKQCTTYAFGLEPTFSSVNSP